MTTWIGPVPEKCDTCETPIVDKFYDEACIIQGRRIFGSICPSCHTFGPGCGKLGPGFGQEYTKQSNGDFLKTGG